MKKTGSLIITVLLLFLTGGCAITYIVMFILFLIELIKQGLL